MSVWIAAIAAMVPVMPLQATNSGVRSLDLHVQGAIAQHCQMGEIDDIDFGDLTRPGLGVRAQVRLNCNIPFTMGIRAQNGALAHAQMPSGQGPYSGVLPYRMAVRMPVRRPQNATIERSFESRELSGNGRTISSEGGIAVDGVALSLALGSPSGDAGLLAGNYGETIVITITPD